MLLFIIRRLGVMLLTAFALTFIVFYLTNLPPNLEKLAKSEASVRMSDEDVLKWIDNNGYSTPVLSRYGPWLGVLPGWVKTQESGEVRGRCIARGQDPAEADSFCGLMQGDWGTSTVFKIPVTDVLARSLSHTGWLMMSVMLVMVPASLLLGVLSGMREGSRTDRVLSTVAIVTTATPEYVSGVIFIALLASATGGISPMLAEWGWIEGKTLFMGTATSAMDKFLAARHDHRALCHRLHRPHDPRLDDRGDDRPIHPHRAAERRQLPSGRDAPRAAQCADRPLHSHHAAISLALERRRDCRDLVQLQGLWLDTCPSRHQQ